jgi:cell division septal protein FtsQ
MSQPTVALRRRGAATPGVAAPDDKRFRRSDVRPGGRRRLAWWCWRAARIGTVVAAAGGAAYCGVATVAASDVFAISRITVRGNTRLSAIEVETLLQGVRGQNILSADIADYGRRVMQSPWVAGATMRRVLPDTLEVRIVERTPMALARIDERLFLIDGTGVIVDEFGPEYQEFDVPLVDGLVRADPAGTARVDLERVELARRFLEALQGDAALRAKVSQIDVTAPGDVSVLLDGDATIVHLGDVSFAERLRRYEELAPTLRERLREIDYVDMRFDERVYVKSKGRYVPVSKANEG